MSQVMNTYKETIVSILFRIGNSFLYPALAQMRWCKLWVQNGKEVLFQQQCVAVSLALHYFLSLGILCFFMSWREFTCKICKRSLFVLFIVGFRIIYFIQKNIKVLFYYCYYYYLFLSLLLLLLVNLRNENDF